MQIQSHLFFALCNLLLASTLCLGETSSLPAPVKHEVDFDRDVRPILETHCFDCHQGKEASSGVRLDHKPKLLGQTDGIPLVEPGNSAESRLIQLVADTNSDERMPPAGEGAPLTPAQISVLRTWIDQGVSWNHEMFPDISAAETDHWSFQPIRRPQLPAIQDHHWPQNAIDHFILARLEAHALQPSPPANQRALIRRLAFNLQGLPTNGPLLQESVADSNQHAYDDLLERLLASPHYGERWARHWLDVARFAESSGFVENHNWPHIWRYRDWVIDSFNTDKPFDVFVTQQLAGDELEPYQDENMIATGFLATARLSSEELSCVRQENDMYVDIVNATASAFLGLTMACSQCHDHKFDPITQRDYYRLQAFFVKGYPGNLVLKQSQLSDDFHQAAEALRQHTLAIRERILRTAYEEKILQDVRDIMLLPTEQRTGSQESTFRLTRAVLNIRLAGCNAYRITDEEKEKTKELQAALNKEMQAVEQVWGFFSPPTSKHQLSVLPMAGNFPLVHNPDELGQRQAWLLRRGDPYSTSFAVEPGWPKILQLEPTVNSAPEQKTTKNRIHLARWLTSPKNPLTARVWVNRIWHYHFGRGLVATPGNFGVRGAMATHPDLLDYLASELITSGWSTKHIHRLILTSNTYRQSASQNEVAATKDPDNRLFWRFPTRRLESEAIRDAALCASGQLDRQIGGPSVPVGQDSNRRSLYHFQRRDAPQDMQSLFDGPTAMSASCDQRHVSTTTLQSLFLLNSPRGEGIAESLAARLRLRIGNDPHELVLAAFRQILGRDPSPIEITSAQRYLSTEIAHAANQNPATPVLAHDDPIKRWEDQLVGPNQDLDQATASATHRQPRFRNGEHGLNGRPVIHFAGGPFGQADHVLEIEESPEIELQNSYSIFVVLRFLGNGIGNQTILMKARGGGTDIGTLGLLRYAYNGPVGRIGIDQNIDGAWSSRVHSSKDIPDEVPLLLIASWDGTKVTLDVRQADGVFSRDEAELKGKIDTSGTGKLGIGGYRDAFSADGERFHGDIAEILIYRQSLPESQVEQVAGYLIDKWLTASQKDDSANQLPVTESLGLHLDAAQGVVPHQPTTMSPLARLCQVLMNLNEFVYIP
ncbi:MAG: DUF1553 domain-containing protein [Pirellulaceae bacterium]|nr:DUF1553 domain-containing protein [Pirellulaceae bacterium]